MLELAQGKIERTFRAGLSAWWVLLLIAGYGAFAWRFLGTMCLLASTTGLPCPGCGMTRAAFALIRGDFAASLRYHPLLIPTFVVLAVYFFTWLTHERTPRWATRMLAVFTAVIGGAYAVRLLLYFPREAPMQLNWSSILLRLCRFAANLLQSSR